MAKRWYIIQALSNFETKVADAIREQAKHRHLDHLFEEIIVPMEKLVEVRHGQRYGTERKFFPGYVLAKVELTDEAYHLIRNTPKVTGFLGSHKRPTPISDAEAAYVLHQIQEGIERPKPVVSFQVGEQVRVSDGPFASFNATVDIIMPDLDGWTVLAAIKGDPELAITPVVLISIVDQKNRGYALGAADYLVKPVDRAKLVETLTSICGAAAGVALLVDDDELVRRCVRQALEPVGWKVTEAENGEVAVEMLAAGRPDVIILDLMMPKMDGFEFLHQLRSRPEWQDIPVVVVTAKDLTQEDRDRLNGGVERIIQKSDRDEMLRQLSREISKCVKRQAVRGA